MTDDERRIDMAGPLDGVRVIDLSRALAGPYATLMLADAGAEVIKVERPGAGDVTRGWGPPFVGEGDEREATYFLAVNRSKRSVVLDLLDTDDMRRLHELIVDADVLVENFRPGVMARLGLTPDALEALNERLVVLSITGFGEDGPDGHRPGFDQIVQGEAGWMSVTGSDPQQPTKLGIPMTDILSGMFGAFGVVAALQERERSGRGQRVTTSLLESAVAVHAFQGTRWLLAGEVPAITGNQHPSIAPYGSFRCRDGFVNIAVGSEQLWARFAPFLGIETTTPEFATNADRVRNRSGLHERIERALADRDVVTCVDDLGALGVPAGRVRTMDEVYAWDQVEHLGLIDRVEHPVLGPLELPGPGVKWSRSSRGEPQPPPTVGQHDHEYLAAPDVPSEPASDPGELATGSPN